MASLEFVNHTPRQIKVVGEQVVWGLLEEPSLKLPQIFWSDWQSWGEANIWALEQLTTPGVDPDTPTRSMWHLLAYANWLESMALTWWHFPEQERERCLPRYRGALIEAIKTGRLSSSTASQAMATIIRFYKWVRQKRLISPEWPMWTDRQIGIRISDAFGFEHTIRLASTDLAIPHRITAGAFGLEDGVEPVSLSQATSILRLAEEKSSQELRLMLRLGFSTGMRIGTITDLKEDTLLSATLDPTTSFYSIQVGPLAHPPVATKFSKNGIIRLRPTEYTELVSYLSSTRRLKRKVLAKANGCADLLFLTRMGRGYNERDSSAVNVEMMRLRRAGLLSGLDFIQDFYFHRTRATFATEYMRVAMQFMPIGTAVKTVCDACMHKDESVTMKYVKFIQTTKQMAEAANAFTQLFQGLTTQE